MPPPCLLCSGVWATGEGRSHCQECLLWGPDVAFVGITLPTASSLDQPGGEASLCSCCGCSDSQTMAAVLSRLLWCEASGLEEGANGSSQHRQCEVSARGEREEGKGRAVVRSLQEGLHGLDWAGVGVGGRHSDFSTALVRIRLGGFDQYSVVRVVS